MPAAIATIISGAPIDKYVVATIIIYLRVKFSLISESAITIIQTCTTNKMAKFASSGYNYVIIDIACCVN